MITISQSRFTGTCAVEDIESVIDYSGRGMHGRRCVGIVGSARDLMRFTLTLIEQQTITESDDSFIEVAAETPRLIHENWLNVQWDGMGRQTIFYWPDVQVYDDTE